MTGWNNSVGEKKHHALIGLNEEGHLYIKGSSVALRWAEQVGSGGRLLGAGATNGLLMKAEEDGNEAGPDGGRAATLSSGQTSTARKPSCRGQKVRDRLRAAIKPHAPSEKKNPSLAVHPLSGITPGCDVPLQRHALTPSTLWSADKPCRGEAKWTDLPANSISIELSAT